MKTVKSELRPSYVTDEHLDYLDDLRDSGETNMFGANRYIVAQFNLTHSVAREILAYWMQTFGNVKR